MSPPKKTQPSKSLAVPKKSLSSRSRGRPYIITQKVIDTIADGIRRGYDHRFASARAGVAHNSFLVWMTKGKKVSDNLSELYSNGFDLKDSLTESETLLVILYESVQKAMYECFNPLIDVIMDHARRDPEYALKLLERRLPETWGRHYTAKIESESTQQIKVVIEVPAKAESSDEWDSLVVESERSLENATIIDVGEHSNDG